MKILSSLFLLICLFSCSTHEENLTIISGKLLGYNGEPLKTANINFNYDEIKPNSKILNNDGTFEIKTNQIGCIWIEFSGENHQSLNLPILLSKQEKIELNIRLSVKTNKKSSEVKFKDKNSISAKYQEIIYWYKDYKKEHNLDMVEEEIFKRIASEQKIENKSLYCYLYLSKFFRSPKIEVNNVKEILQIIEPSSIVWDMGAQMLGILYFILPKEDHEYYYSYIERISNENQYPTAKSEAINYLLATAEMEKDSVSIQKFYKRLISECPESFRTKDAKFKYEILAPGKNILSFSVNSIDNSEEIYTEKSMLGKTYLMDFWATWCGPCLGELPFLHDAYKNYKEKGFEILSLSLDNSIDDVIQFRKGEWKMPWLHAFLDGSFKNEIAIKFGVHGIPKTILVDAKGKVIATENKLRGNELDKTLANYFGKMLN